MKFREKISEFTAFSTRKNERSLAAADFPPEFG